MASLGQRFDASQHDTEQRDFDNLPDGIYRLEIEKSEVVPTSTGTGTILKTVMVAIEPEEYKGRKVFTNYNLENQNPQAQEIGQKQFASLCRAIGVREVDDSEQLHFQSFTAKLGLGKASADGKYPARTEIKRYYFPDQEVPAPGIDVANDNKPAVASASRAAPAAANNNRPAPAQGARPWARSA